MIIDDFHSARPGTDPFTRANAFAVSFRGISETFANVSVDRAIEHEKALAKLAALQVDTSTLDALTMLAACTTPDQIRIFARVAAGGQFTFRDYFELAHCGIEVLP